MLKVLSSHISSMAGYALLLWTPGAGAHHSFAMFDFQRDVTLLGTVKEFQWNNPHVFIDLLVPGESGSSIWSVEMTSPSHLVRNGWKPTTLKPGDQVSIVIHPLRDGRAGGMYLSGTRANGNPVVAPATNAAGVQP
jgi:hypothetical protein